jgi:hypothetical protein
MGARMSYRTVVLKAGVPVQLNVKGKVILIDDTGAAEGVDITPISAGSSHPKMPKRQKAFKYFVDYDGVELEAADDCTISLFLSQTDVSLGFASGALVNVLGGVSVLNDPDNRVPVDTGGGAVIIANGAQNRVPVDIGGGVVQVTADNVGISNTDATAIPMRQRAADVFAVKQPATEVFAVQEKLLTALVDIAPVVVGIASVALVGDASLKRLRVRNTHATARVALGGVGVTMANAAVVLEPGDMWTEDAAPGAEWFAVSDTAGVNVTMQGVK